MEERQHAKNKQGAAKRDRRRELLRERPQRPTLTAAGRKVLRDRARDAAELQFRVQALSASSRACIETKREAQRFAAEIRQQLPRVSADEKQARVAAERWSDPSRVEAYTRARERLESELAEHEETAAAMLDEQASLQAQAAEITAVLGPLNDLLEAVCSRLGKTRAELGLAIRGGM